MQLETSLHSFAFIKFSIFLLFKWNSPISHCICLLQSENERFSTMISVLVFAVVRSSITRSIIIITFTPVMWTLWKRNHSHYTLYSLSLHTHAKSYKRDLILMRVISFHRLFIVFLFFFCCGGRDKDQPTSNGLTSVDAMREKKGTLSRFYVDEKNNPSYLLSDIHMYEKTNKKCIFFKSIRSGCCKKHNRLYHHLSSYLSDRKMIVNLKRPYGTFERILSSVTFAFFKIIYMELLNIYRYIHTWSHIITMSHNAELREIFVWDNAFKDCW